MNIEKIKDKTEPIFKDLVLLSAIDDPGKLQNINAALSNKDIQPEELFNLVPYEAAKLACALSDDSTFERILSELEDEGARETINAAKLFVDTKLQMLSKHPVILNRLVQEAAQEAEAHKKMYTVVAGISHNPALHPVREKGKDKYLPSIRLFFIDAFKRPILDTTNGWDEILFIPMAILKTVASEFELRTKLANDLIISDPEKIAQRISEIEEYLAKIKKHAKDYNIPLKQNEPPKAES